MLSSVVASRSVSSVSVNLFFAAGRADKIHLFGFMVSVAARAAADKEPSAARSRSLINKHNKRQGGGDFSSEKFLPLLGGFVCREGEGGGGKDWTSDCKFHVWPV